MSPASKKRLSYFLIIGIVTLILGKFIFGSLQKNTVYFFSPTDLFLSSEKPRGVIRIGGLVKTGSIQAKKND